MFQIQGLLQLGNPKYHHGGRNLIYLNYSYKLTVEQHVFILFRFSYRQISFR